MTDEHVVTPFSLALRGLIYKPSRQNDASFFQMAIDEALLAFGVTSPNPPVGAVLVKSGRVIGCGHTSECGGPHAEVNAAANALEAVAGSTLYVTLEPCAHFGKTPPCVEKIIDLGIRRVVYGVRDPNPLVSGKGLAKLEKAGVEVSQIDCPSMELRAHALIKPFEKACMQKRPYVIVKLATNFEGESAEKRGVRTQISSEKSKVITHGLRKHVDAILVGANTAIIDNPQLTVRVVDPAGAQPIKVILDAKLKVPIESKVFQCGRAIVFYDAHASSKKKEALQNKGVTCVPIGLSGSRLDLNEVMLRLHELGILTLMVESGGGLLQSLHEHKMIDEFWWLKSNRPFENGYQAFNKCSSKVFLDFFKRTEQHENILGSSDVLLLAAN